MNIQKLKYLMGTTMSKSVSQITPKTAIHDMDILSTPNNLPNPGGSMPGNTLSNQTSRVIDYATRQNEDTTMMVYLLANNANVNCHHHLRKVGISMGRSLAPNFTSLFLVMLKAKLQPQSLNLYMLNSI